MLETMAEYAGVGLAAPQVHHGLRLFVMQTDPDDEETLRVAVNPRLTPLGEEGWEDWEGCLSIPDIHGRVPRSTSVRLEALDESGRSVCRGVGRFRRARVSARIRPSRRAYLHRQDGGFHFSMLRRGIPQISRPEAQGRGGVRGEDLRGTLGFTHLDIVDTANALLGEGFRLIS